MANLSLYLRNRAPGVGAATAVAGTSCTWNTLSPYSFLVVAWYTESEDNIYNAGFVNYGFNYALSGFSYEDQTDWFGVAFANTSLKPHITWTAPEGPTPHHYSIYYQADSATTYDFRSVGYKLNAADISPGTLAYTGPVDPPDVGTNTDVVMTNVNPAYKSIRVDGNHLVSFGGGTFVTVDYGVANRAMTVSYSKLIRNARGVQTEIFMSSTADFGDTQLGGADACTNGSPSATECTCATATFETDGVGVGDTVTNVTTGNAATVVSVDSETTLTTTSITGNYTAADSITVTSKVIATGELVRYRAGRATFGQTLYKTPAWGLIEVVVLDPIVQLTPKLANRGHRTFDGYIAKSSQVNERLTDELNVEIAGVSCTHENWMQLLLWYEAQSTIWMIDKTEAYTDQDHTLHPQYMGKLDNISYLGSKGKNAKDTYSFTFVVESEQSQGIGLF